MPLIFKRFPADEKQRGKGMAEQGVKGGPTRPEKFRARRESMVIKA
ncbi:MAG: hypothetical protein ILA34_03725 [Bacteroidaceae bacterium]|nr:hypothetical protein [Bacteroidaceae bacterium]